MSSSEAEEKRQQPATTAIKPELSDADLDFLARYHAMRHDPLTHSDGAPERTALRQHVYDLWTSCLAKVCGMGGGYVVLWKIQKTSTCLS